MKAILLILLLFALTYSIPNPVYTIKACFEKVYDVNSNSNLLWSVENELLKWKVNEFYEKDKVQYTFDIKDDIKNKLVILQFLDPSTEEELEKEGNLIEPNFILCKKTKNKRITYTERRFEENYKKKNVI